VAHSARSLRSLEECRDYIMAQRTVDPRLGHAVRAVVFPFVGDAARRPVAMTFLLTYQSFERAVMNGAEAATIEALRKIALELLARLEPGMRILAS
jgi:hypothetical protein